MKIHKVFVLLAALAILVAGTAAQDEPIKIGIVDLEQAITTRKGFLTRYADRPVLVLGTHFAGPTAGWFESHGSSWRFSVESPHD